MTTVLAVYNSEGCVGRCDATCHNAKSRHCDCICGGKNHGKGLAQAIANNHERFDITPEDLAKFARTHGFQCEGLVAVDVAKAGNMRRAGRQAMYELAKAKREVAAP